MSNYPKCNLIVDNKEYYSDSLYKLRISCFVLYIYIIGVYGFLTSKYMKVYNKWRSIQTWLIDLIILIVIILILLSIYSYLVEDVQNFYRPNKLLKKLPKDSERPCVSDNGTIIT
jgi:hypothetical protein